MNRHRYLSSTLFCLLKLDIWKQHKNLRVISNIDLVDLFWKR
jgi:hypothetical protein